MESVYRVVRDEESGTFAIMNMLTRDVMIDELHRRDLMSIMEGCSKWIDEIEEPTAQAATTREEK